MTRSLSVRRCGAVFVAFLAAAAILSCTSAGDGGVSGTNDYLSRGVVVDPVTPTVLSYVTLAETAGDATSTCVGVEVHRVSNLFSAAFSVSYDPTILRFRDGGDATASCLGTGATVLTPQVDSTVTPGRIVVGLTRNIGTIGTGSDSCGHLIDLCFDVIAPGQFDMTFVGNLALLKPDGTPVDNLGTNWIGAHVTVTQ